MQDSTRKILIGSALGALSGSISYLSLVWSGKITITILAYGLFLMPGWLLGSLVLWVLGVSRPAIWIGFSTLCWYASWYGAIQLASVVEDLRVVCALVSALSFATYLFAARANFMVRLSVPLASAAIGIALFYGAIIGEFYAAIVRAFPWSANDNSRWLLAGIIGWQANLVTVLSAGQIMHRSDQTKNRAPQTNGSATLPAVKY